MAEARTSGGSRLRGARPALVLCALACASCSSESFVQAPAPPSAARSWVFAFVGDEATLLYAGPIDEPIVFSAHVARGAPGPDPLSAPGWAAPYRAELAYFEARLDELGIAAGPVMLAAPGAPARTLPTPAAQHRLDLERSGAGSWSSPSWSELAESHAQLPRRDPCARLLTQQFVLGSDVGAVWALPLDEDRALVATGDNQIWTIDRQGRSSTVAVVPEQPDFIPTSALKDDHGELWFGGAYGHIWRGSMGTTLSVREVALLPTLERIVSIDADPADPAGDLYVFTTSGALARVSGSTVTALHRFEGHPNDVYASVAWMELGSVVSGWGGSAEVLITHGDRLERISVGDGRTGVHSLRRVPGLGLMAATSGGQIFRWNLGARRFDPLGQSGVRLEVFDFFPYAGGFFYTGTFGYVGQWLDGFGYCPVAEPPLAAATARHIVPLGEALLIVGDARHEPLQTPFVIATVAR